MEADVGARAHVLAPAHITPYVDFQTRTTQLARCIANISGAVAAPGRDTRGRLSAPRTAIQEVETLRAEYDGLDGTHDLLEVADGRRAKLTRLAWSNPRHAG